MRIRRRLIPAITLITLSLGAFAGGAQAAPAPAVSVADQARTTLDLLIWGSAGDDVRVTDSFGRHRDALAADIATRYGLEANTLLAEWNRADAQHQTALLAALGQIGVRYRRNTSSPGVGFDCSGLTAYAWSRAGLDIAHQSRSQINAAAQRTRDTVVPGDLVYYPGHVMLYVGAGLMVHAPYTGKTVEIDTLPRHNLRYGDPSQ